MPSARLSTRTASRRVMLLALTIAFAAFLVSLAATETGSACGGPPPKPLRALYTESDLIVVARVGATVPVEMASVDEQGLKVYLTKTSLHVDSTVKGQGNHAVIPLYNLRWQEQDNHEVPTSYGEYADTDKLLFFLKRRADGEGYQEADSSYGVKQLSDADLRVYIERMDELALILQQEQPDPARIVEWLVRCAEEPATRWEGLYELSSSKDLADANQTEEKEPAAAEEGTGKEGGETAEGEAEANHASSNQGEPGAEGASEAEASPGEDDAANTDPRVAKLLDSNESYYTPDPELIGLLTAEQKKRLADVLFNIKQVTDEELPLIEMVKGWHDPRFVPFALAQLRSFVDEPPYLAEPLATALAESLDNEGLMKLAASYSEKSRYYDEEAADAAAAQVEAGEAEAATADAASGEESVGEKAEEEKVEEDPVEKAFEESLTGNSAEKRRLRLQRFIARAEVALAN